MTVDYPVTPDADGVAVVRDARGWVYRLIAPSPQGAVLEVGDAFATNWLPNVIRTDLRENTLASLAPGRFDFVVLHYSLGGLETLDDALTAASRMLRRGGLVAVAGANRFRPTKAARLNENRREPRKTAWGYRFAFRKAGFGNVTLFITHPPGDAPVYLVDAHPLSAQAFFRTALRDRHISRWSPMQPIVKAIIKLNVMPYFESGLLVVGHKC